MESNSAQYVEAESKTGDFSEYLLDSLSADKELLREYLKAQADELRSTRSQVIDEFELEKAAQQFIGYGHAIKGYRVVELAKAMGLTKAEYDLIRDDIRSSLKCVGNRDFEELDAYFKSEMKNGK